MRSRPRPRARMTSWSSLRCSRQHGAGSSSRLIRDAPDPGRCLAGTAAAARASRGLSHRRAASGAWWRVDDIGVASKRARRHETLAARVPRHFWARPAPSTSADLTSSRPPLKRTRASCGVGVTPLPAPCSWCHPPPANGPVVCTPSTMARLKTPLLCGGATCGNFKQRPACPSHPPVFFCF